MAQERLQKILARAGYGSRRSCEKLIEAGRVKVNGQTVSLGDKADPARDQIHLDGAPIKPPESFSYIALYKPRGVLSSSRRENDLQTVLDLVPSKERLYPVGRLDLNSEGLILLTNDGALANTLTHPRYGHEKEYRVLVARHPDQKQLAAWRRGVVLSDGYKTQPVQVRIERPYGKGTWLRVIMTEGRKRQIRETTAQLGLPVAKLIRIRIGSLYLGKMKPKQWRHLEDAEITALKGKPINRPQQGKRK